MLYYVRLLKNLRATEREEFGENVDIYSILRHNYRAEQKI